ncbi:hypothetical protein F4813DRAFT_224148 [Daldinia decipiens]|uniref:uncharacterized protein n=1 Tax=Daldinia decipiens TaxID=326647 RepID=UPI0020C2E6C1|nr:uncharacterized protein F4813DRAFT_224148 [Daldinia decipiens]KAI1661297.1 hypothetical protein F4813DRAFT_224148 [Daldinia decipiens]
MCGRTSYVVQPFSHCDSMCLTYQAGGVGISDPSGTVYRATGQVNSGSVKAPRPLRAVYYLHRYILPVYIPVYTTLSPAPSARYGCRRKARVLQTCICNSSFLHIIYTYRGIYLYIIYARVLYASALPPPLTIGSTAGTAEAGQDCYSSDCRAHLVSPYYM